MGIVQSRDRPAAAKVDQLRRRTAQLQYVGVGADRDKSTAGNGDGSRLRLFRVHGGDLSVVEDKIRGLHERPPFGKPV
jgi:hypothetical protein